MIRPSPWKSLNVRVPLVTSVLLLLGFWLVALILGALQLEDLKTLLGKAQRSTAGALAQEIEQEVEERFQALNALAVGITRSMVGSPARVQAILDERPGVYVPFNSGAYVTDAQGVAVASVPADLGRVGVSYLFRNHVRQALLSGANAVSDIAIGVALKRPVVSLAVPLKDAAGVFGSLVGVIDLTSANFLDQLAGSPMGVEGGFLLVSRQQRLIVTASDKTRIMEELPAEGVNGAIDDYLSGAEGTRILVNPHGLEVLVSVRQIPAHHWYVAVYDSTREAFAPLNQLAIRLLVVALSLTLTVGLANWFLVRRQLRPVVRAMQVLAEASSETFSPDLIPVVRQDEVGALIQSFKKILTDRERQAAAKAEYEKMVSQNQRVEALGVLAGGISHDFNNLLSGIYGNMELALHKDKGGPATPYLTKTLDTLGRARDLTRQLMTFSRGGQPELKVASLFPFVETSVRFALSGSAVSVRFEVDATLGSCAYDPHQLGQAIENLVINAVQAMPGGGTLHVGATTVLTPDGRRWIRLSLTDTGVGMSRETLEHLFEPFFTTKAEGHGLGLTMCHSIVTQHGGTMKVESEPGKGTTFILDLPEKTTITEGTPAPATPSVQGTGTILVMDDDPAVGEVLESLLQDLGYQVVRTYEGNAALQAFQADRDGPNRLVAAILDLTIPGGAGGLETLVNIRKTDKEIPVIVASGYSDAPILANPEAYGFNAAVRKPYLRAELLKALSRVLRSPHEHGMVET